MSKLMDLGCASEETRGVVPIDLTLDSSVSKSGNAYCFTKLDEPS